MAPQNPKDAEVFKKANTPVTIQPVKGWIKYRNKSAMKATVAPTI